MLQFSICIFLLKYIKVSVNMIVMSSNGTLYGPREHTHVRSYNPNHNHVHIHSSERNPL